ncbi:MAG TPA: hypothetical protein VND21_08160 [Planctomycetota bacterium]|nr:hypothetical protein [Planctomycetota bacterium]
MPLDPTGRYEVRLGADAVPATRELTVVAAIPGRAYVRYAIRISPGDDVQVDLVSGAVGREGTLRGHVQDEAGRPVPGLRLRIQRSLTNDEAELDLETRLADPESDAPEGYTSASEGIVTTGPDGRFALAGLSGTQYGVASLDDDWLVWYASSATATGLRVDSGEGALVAARAFVLEVRVTDAETGEALEPIRINERIRLNGELGGSNNAVGNVNPTLWQARIPPGGELGFDVVVDAGATGYRSARRTVRFEPGRWLQRLEVALTRPRYERGELGRLRLLHALLDETGRPAPLAATLWEVVEDGERVGRKAQVTRGDDGFETLELPAGPATEVQLGVRRGGPVRWHGKVDVVGGGTMDFRVPFPPAGALQVHMAGTEGRRLALIGPEGQRTSTSHKVPVDRKAQTVFLPGVPIGKWRIQVDGAGEESAVTVEVEEGRVTEAVLPK